MKKVLIGIFVFLFLIIVALALVPVLFKDNIKAAIDRELAKSVNADVFFDVDNFSLSVFKNFPNITATLKDFGVINRAPFEGEVLFAADEMQIEVNIKSILMEDQPRIKGIFLDHPVINIIALADGRANYDIAISTEDVSEEEIAETTEFSISIDHWEIVNGYIMVDYQPATFSMELQGLNHKGNGDFTETVFDLRTNSTIEKLLVTYDGTTYLSNNTASIDAVIAIAEDYTLYTFKENQALLNDFAFGFDGWFKMNENDYDMDISFATKDNSFKSLLSLVPGMYTESFAGLKSEGELNFSGMVKGKYSDDLMPAFNLSLNVKDGFFQYPDLPAPVSNVQVDLLVDNKDGIIENTYINLKQMHIDFGSNPFDATLIVENLKDYTMNASVNGKLNLAELNTMFPIDGLSMRGIFSVNASAKGVYDSLRKIVPAMDVKMSLVNGYVKSSEFPAPLEDLKFNSSINNSSGKMAETTIRVNDFSMLLEGEHFVADMILQNLDDYTWDVKASGGIDLEKITKIFPLEGMSLVGNIKADLKTQGKMSDLEAERYDKLPTSGSISIKNFKYEDKELPYVIALSTAQGSFDPRKIEIKEVKGTIGNSDFEVSGAFTNYMGYIFGESEVIKGSLNYTANLLDLNEFMEETEQTTEESAEEEAYTVIPIPSNIDFVLKSKVKSVKVMDLTMANAEGEIVLREGIANLNGLKFNMLGGSFVVTGAYNTQDISKPSYDFGLKVDNLSIAQAYSTFSTIQTFVPIAEKIAGNFSTDFKVNGLLQQDMMPDMASVNGDGLVKILQATVKESQIISGISSLTKLEDAGEVTLRDVIMSASINDGRLSVKPFDVKIGNYATTVAGSTGLDGSISYNLKMIVPAGKLGADFNSLVSQYAGGTSATTGNQNIPLTIGLGGTYANPRPTLIMDEQKQQVRDAITSAAEEKGKEALQQAVKGSEAEKLVGGLLGGKKTGADSTSKDSTVIDPVIPVTKEEVKEKVEEEKKKLEEEAQNKIKNLLKRKGGG